MKKNLITSLLILAILVSSCTSMHKESLIATKADVDKVSPTRTPTVQKTATPTRTLNPTEATQAYILAATQTQMAQYPANCENYMFTSTSPNMEWLALSCDHNSNSRMIVASKSGKRWEILLTDLLAAEDGEMGGFVIPAHWNTDYNIQYFETYLNWDGGGSQCIRYGDGYGLYRLNLASGTWYPIVPTVNEFPGYVFDFSPTDEYVVLNKNGATLINLLTNENTIINAYPSFSFEWNSDGSKLAYSVGTCSEETWLAETSAVFVYDLETGESKKLMSVDDELLWVGEWQDDDHVEITSQKAVSEQYSGEYTYTDYLYDIIEDEYGIVTSTPTPTP
jgi:hypothetical protein